MPMPNIDEIRSVLFMLCKLQIIEGKIKINPSIENAQIKSAVISSYIEMYIKPE